MSAPSLIRERPDVDRAAGADIAIRTIGLSKAYKIYDKPFSFLKEALTGRPYHRDKHALADISLDIRRGEIVGVIGRNGAGKSTLLKLIAGTLSPTKGLLEVNGRVSAILELGTGFNPAYSGRDNVVLSALMRGMPEAEVLRKFESIVTFAGLEDVIDLPFHTYSSGMQARLAFAAAVSVEADVLIIDEALAAGDIRFAARSLRRIHEICQSGVTALFVSHVTYHIMQLCTRAVWIEDGYVRMDGPPIEVVRAYEYVMHTAVARDQGRMIESDPNASASVDTSVAPDAAAAIDAAASAMASEPVDAGDLAAAVQSGEAGQRSRAAAAAMPTENVVEGDPDRGDSGSNVARQAEPQHTDTPVELAAWEPIDELSPPTAPIKSEVGVPSAVAVSPAETAIEMVTEREIAVFAPSHPPRSPVRDSLASVQTQAKPSSFSTGQYRIREIAFLDRNGQPATAFRFGELLRIRVAYECLLAELPEYSCGLAVAFNRTSDFEAIMYLNTNYPHSDDELRRYFDVPFRRYIGRRGVVEALIDPIQIRAGEYYVSLGIVPNQPGMHEFYEYLHCQYQISILPNGFDEPSVFYPMVTWTNGAIGPSG